MAIAAGFPPSSCFADSPPACRRCVLQRGDLLLLGQNEHGETDDDGGSDCQRGAVGNVQRGDADEHVDTAQLAFAKVVEKPGAYSRLSFARALK